MYRLCPEQCSSQIFARSCLLSSLCKAEGSLVQAVTHDEHFVVVVVMVIVAKAMQHGTTSVTSTTYTFTDVQETLLNPNSLVEIQITKGLLYG